MVKQTMLYFLISLLLSGRTQDKQLVLTHVTVMDIRNGNLLKDVSVVIRGNRISDIGRTITIPPGATAVDASGKYLIPGLWDMHVHLSFYGEQALPMLVANGITGVRDMGGSLSQLDKWSDEIATGGRIGPRIKKAGPFLDGPKKMSPLRSSFTRIVTDDKEVALLIDSLKIAGVDFLKVHSRLPRNVFFALADEANKQHIPFSVHLPKDVTPEEASDAGARSIEHIESLLGSVIYEEQETMRVKLTDSALHRLYDGYGQQLAARIAKNKNFYAPTLISLYRVKGTDYEKMLAPKLLPLVRELYLAGVPLLTGSDFAGKDAGIRPGFDLHDELVLLTKAGMKPLEALQAATITPVKCLSMEDSLGSIEKGKIADLVLLNENPLKDIRNTRKIYAVILNGRYFSARKLHAMLQISPDAHE